MASFALQNCRRFCASGLVSVTQRKIHCTATVQGLSKAQSRQKVTRKSERMMERKVIGKLSKKKFFYSPLASESSPKSRLKKPSISLGLTKRLQQVGSILHENISFLFDSGALGQELVDHGVEISKVEIPPDFGCVNILWFGSGIAERDDKLSNLLEEKAYKLRHDLTQLRVIASVPKINFVKDLSLARYTEIEQLLQTADMGPDVASQDVHSGENEEIDLECDLVQDMNDLNLRSDLYDVDHEALTKQVNLHKHKKTDRFFNFDSSPASVEKGDAEFAQFLTKRRHSRVKSDINRSDAFASMETLRSLSGDSTLGETRSDQKKHLYQAEEEDDEDNYDEDSSPPGTSGV